MRARGSILAALGLAALAAGCNSATTDACKGVAGSCVSLTVQSTTVAEVDALHIAASGALSGDQMSAGGRAKLPIAVALELPATASGGLDLHVDGLLVGAIVGSCDTSANVVPGQHTTAVCTLVGASGGGGDMAGGGGGGGGGGGVGGGDMGGADMAPAACDPQGMTGPQCQWRWQTPLPNGDDLTAVVGFADSDTFAISEDGIVLHRDATSWSPLPAQPALSDSPTTSLFANPALSMMDLYATGDDATGPALFHSSDHGATWVKETLPGVMAGNYVYGGANAAGYAVLTQYSNIVLSRDAPTNAWSAQTVTGGGFYTAAAMDYTTEVVVGSSSSTAAIAYHFNNAWTVVPTASITPSTETLRGACLGPDLTNNSWWAVGGAVILHASGKQPGTWAQQGASITAGANLYGCVAVDATHAWAYGVNGALFATSDGSTWMSIGTALGTTETINGGARSSGGVLTFVGTKGVIFRSTNGGTSFAAERTGPSDALSAVYGPSQGNVFAVGSGGSIYTTSNEGATWTKLAAPSKSGTTAQLNGVWASSPTDIYAVGQSGTIVHSSDAMTFTKYAGANAPPATASMKDVYGSSQLGVFVVGADSTAGRIVLRSTDHGASWSPVTISGFTGVAGQCNTVFAIGGDIWIAGDGGNVYHSTDGTTWTPQPITPMPSTAPAVSQLRGVAGHLIAAVVTDPGTYVTSTNNGTTWTAPTISPWSGGANTMGFVPDESAIYAFLAGASPVVSYDKAGTWKPLTTVMAGNNMQAAFAFAANDVFIVGNTGIIHYGN